MIAPPPRTLALVVVSRGPASRVAAILERARPSVDEVVVAADAAGDPALADLRGALADDVAWFESPGCLEGVLLWAMRRCRSDWILRLDDDEVPSPALLAECRDPGLEEVTHALVPRRWVFPDATAWIASPPWGEDLQLRLVRNVPPLWKQGAAPHDPLEVLGPFRVLRSPIYHADLVLADETARRAKAARYDVARPGLFMEGLPGNSVYLPEDFEGLTQRPVDAADRAAVSALLEARGASASATAPPERPAGAKELLQWTTDPVIDERAHDGAVRAVGVPAQLPAGMWVQLLLEVENRSPLAWPSEHAADSPVRVGLSWDGLDPVPRVLLPTTVEAGATHRLRCLTQVPAVVGPRTLRFRLVHEHVAWFGGEAAVEVEVVPPPGDRPPFRARAVGKRQLRFPGDASWAAPGP